MNFVFVFLNAASIALLAHLLGFEVKRRHGVSSAPSLIALTAFALVWSIGSFAEILVRGFAMKLFWRDLTQVGTFFVPAASLLFALSYVGVSPATRRLMAAIIYPFQALPTVLIATDELHHLMRSGRELYVGPTGIATLSVSSTPLGLFFVSFNFVLMAASFAILVLFAFRVARPMRKQLGIVTLGLVLPVFFAVLRVTMGEAFAFGLPISCAFALGSLVLLFGVYKYDFLSLEPIARDRVFDVIDEGIVVWSVDGHVVDLNKAGLRMLSPHLGQSMAGTLPDAGRVEELLRARLGDSSSAESAEKASGGLVFSLDGPGGKGSSHLSLKTHELRSASGSRIGRVGVLRDVTRERQQLEQLKLRAERDGLTGLYNREAFVELVESSMRLRPGISNLLVFDIDDFKGLNDAYGHQAGDMVLKAVCSSCAAFLREGDLFGRIGGDEFAVFLPETCGDKALALTQGLVEGVAALFPLWEKRKLRVTISLGCAELGGVAWEAGSEGFAEAFGRADRALYAAKAAGKNRIVRSAEGHQAEK